MIKYSFQSDSRIITIWYYINIFWFCKTIIIVLKGFYQTIDENSSLNYLVNIQIFLSMKIVCSVTWSLKCYEKQVK